jgi:predicted GNAT family N-acyltransferase
MSATEPYRFSSPIAPEVEYEVLVLKPDMRTEMESIFAVRMTVFVEEQAVPAEEELDAYDLTSVHFMVRVCSEDTGAVGTARLIDKGPGIAKIGRVAVLREHRGRGVGLELMRHTERYARTAGYTELVLEAQCHAIPFYEKLGYLAEGPIFLDAGIEHRLMKRAL